MSTVIQSHSTLNSWSVRMVDSAIARYFHAPALWHYEDGLVLKGIIEAGLFHGEQRYIDFVDAWIDRFVDSDGSIHTYRMNEFNLDQVNPGKLVFRKFRQTGDIRYRRAIELIRQQLRQHPRTKEGGFWHKNIYPWQMWLDGLYMAEPFYAEYAALFDDAAAWDDIALQFRTIAAHCRDEQSGLLYHGWDERKLQSWADPVSGRSPHIWGRAMGWYGMALVDVLDWFPKNHSCRTELEANLIQSCEAILKVQDTASGLWYQILDMESRAGNYLESSGSGMFIYTFIRAVRMGLLPPQYLEAARRGYRGLLENHIKIDADGLLILEKTCGAAGLGGNPYRDGSYDYYVNEKIITNDPKGVGPFILAAVQMEAVDMQHQHAE